MGLSFIAQAVVSIVIAGLMILDVSLLPVITEDNAENYPLWLLALIDVTINYWFLCLSYAVQLFYVLSAIYLYKSQDIFSTGYSKK